MLRRIGLDACPYCGNFEVYGSRPETGLDRLLALFLFDISRCHGCMRQHYRLIFLPAPDFPHKRDSQATTKDDEWKPKAS